MKPKNIIQTAIACNHKDIFGHWIFKRLDVDSLLTFKGDGV